MKLTRAVSDPLPSTTAHELEGSGRIVVKRVRQEGPAAVLSRDARGQYLRDINCAHNRVRHSGLIRMKLSVIFNTIQDQ